MQFRLCNILETDCSTYLMRVRHGSAMSQIEQAEAWSRTRDHVRTIMHNFVSRVQYEESQGSSQASASFSCGATTPHPTSPHYYTTAGNVHTSFKLYQLVLYVY